MTNEDALRCADRLQNAAYSLPCDHRGWSDDGDPHNECTDGAAHIRRLVAENEGMKHWRDAAVERMRELESDKKVQAALLRQAAAVMGLIGADLVCEAAHHEKKDRHQIGETCPIEKRWHDTFRAIRQHLDQKTT